MLWYFAFFLVSGFCSLVYEVVWLRLAMAKFGVTTPMVSIVLSTFMAGLAIGSWGGGRLTRRSERGRAFSSLRLYSLTEVIIGLSGLVVPTLLLFGYELLGTWGKALRWDSSLYYLASGGWIALSLLPWCICMGATFPLAMFRHPQQPRRVEALVQLSVRLQCSGRDSGNSDPCLHPD
jgi:spermidine synthase